MGEYDYAVLIPVYNEAPIIHAVLDTVRDHYHGELIVLDDGSDDGTTELVAERDDVLWVTHRENEGYGRSLIDGIAYARFLELDHLVTMDCDGQHEPAHLPEFFEAVVHGQADIVSGSRYLPESRTVGDAPEERRRVNERVTAEVNGLTGWGLTDAFCGFKGYKLRSLDGIEFEEPGYAFPMEMWAKAWRAGLAVAELPVERIYLDNDRSFGEDLDDPEKRFDYYMRVWRESLGEAAP